MTREELKKEADAILNTEINLLQVYKLVQLIARQDAYIDELEERIDRYERAFKDRREITKQGK